MSIFPAIEHLFKSILKVNEEEILNVKQLKYKSWDKVTIQLRLKQLDNKDMNMVTYKGMND